MSPLRNTPSRYSTRLSGRDLTYDDQDWFIMEGVDFAESTTPESDYSPTSSSSGHILSNDFPHCPFTPTPSHARKRKHGHVPRPPNAFMIFRSEMWRKKKLTPNIERDHRHVSVIAGLCWRQLTPKEQKPYQILADHAKRQHALEYPNYKYCPVSRKQKSVKRKVKNDDQDKERCMKVASLMIQGIQGPDLETALNDGNRDLDPDVSPPLDSPDDNIPTPADCSPHLWNANNDTSPNESQPNNIGPQAPNTNMEATQPELIGFQPLDVSSICTELAMKQLKSSRNHDGDDLHPPTIYPHIDPNSEDNSLDFLRSILCATDQQNTEELEFYGGNILTNDNDNCTNTAQSDYNIDSMLAFFGPTDSNIDYSYTDVFGIQQPVFNETAYALFQQEEMLSELSSADTGFVDPFSSSINDTQFWF